MATATETKNKVAEFKIKSPGNLITYLKRFAGIDKEKGLLLEIHPDSIRAKAHTPDRSVVKYSKMPIVDVLEGTLPVDLIKVGIHDLRKVINVFNHFSEADEIFLHVKYENVSGEHIATEMLFKGSSLKIKILTADTTTFNFISPEMLKKLIQSVETDRIIEFPFPKEAFSKVNNLCSIDTGKDFLKLNIANSSISIAGKSFEYTVCDVQDGITAEFTFYNEHFGLIEQEISSFIISNNRMLVKSQESDTMIIVGRVE